MPNSVKEIGERAFYADFTSLSIPSTTVTIGKEVCDRSKTRIVVESGSYAALYASENGFATTNSEDDDLSWLHDNTNDAEDDDTSWLGN